MVEMSLKAASISEAQYGDGRTPISYAANDRHAKVVEFLVKISANLEAQDVNGRPSISSGNA
jgi:ankyrin repeat protein